MRVHLQLIAVCIVFSFLSCKKDKNEDVFGGDKLIGYWEINKLEIGGVDTTYFLKGDSACFPKLRFYNAANDLPTISTVRAYEIPDSTFRCPSLGLWTATPKLLIITMQWDSFYVEPFLSKTSITWNVISYSNNRLSLKTNYNGVDCYLTITKQN